MARAKAINMVGDTVDSLAPHIADQPYFPF